jgi:hypothetical protein
MTVEFDNLTREVSEMGTVVDSAITLLQELALMLEEVKNDPVAIQALADELNSKATLLTEAIVANTPVASGIFPPVETFPTF